MTDFRRPDLDPWEEEDDAEDGRPTIVAPRPTSAAPDASPAQGSSGAPPVPRESTPADDLHTPVRARPPALPKPSLVERLIQQGALPENEPTPRESGEVLRASELTLLQLDASDDEGAADDAELVGGDEVEEVAAALGRPLPTAAALPTAPALAPVAALPPPPPKRSFAEREVTERISLPAIRDESIAPTAHTVRPQERRPGAAWWQLGVAALAVVAGGFGISSVRKALREPLSEAPASSATVAVGQPVQPAREFAPLPLTEEAPAEVAESSPPAVEEPAPVAPAEPASAAQPAALAAAEPSLPRERPVPVAVNKSEPRKMRPAPPPAQADADQEPSASSEPAPARAEAEGELPAQPSREQVSAALNAVLPELQKCVGDRGGTAEVTVTVRPQGAVSYALVAGEYAGTPEGSCIARAVKAAKFPAFSDPTLRVTYPFRL